MKAKFRFATDHRDAGRSRSHWPGMSGIPVVYGTYAISQVACGRLAIATSGSIFREELRYWIADGSERIVDFAMHPIRDQSGAVTFLHPTGIDITERKQARSRAS